MKSSATKRDEGEGRMRPTACSPTQRSPRPENQRPMTMAANEGTYQKQPKRHGNAQGREGARRDLTIKNSCVYVLWRNLHGNVYGMLLIYFNALTELFRLDVSKKDI